MSLLRKKSWWQIIRRSPLAIIIMLGIAVAFAFAVYDRYVVEREMAMRRERSESELRRENDRLAELSQEVERLNSDQGIEAEIRKNFDVAKEGETVVILVDDDDRDIEPIPPPPPKGSLWSRFWSAVLPW